MLFAPSALASRRARTTGERRDVSVSEPQALRSPQQRRRRRLALQLVLGEADAGFVYVTDARAVSDRVKVIRIPAWAQPRVRYEIAVMSRSTRKAAARAWIERLLSPRGQRALRSYGFLPVAKPKVS